MILISLFDMSSYWFHFVTSKSFSHHLLPINIKHIMYLHLKAQPYNYMYDVLYKYFLKSIKKSNQKQTTSQNSRIALLNSAIFMCTSFITNIYLPSTPSPQKTSPFWDFVCLFACLFVFGSQLCYQWVL